MIVNKNIQFNLTQINEDGPSLRQAILSLIQVLLSIWQTITPDELHVQRLSGAMSNVVYSITIKSSNPMWIASPNNEPHQLLLRIYGTIDKSEGGVSLLQRDQEERHAMWLAESSLAPQWLAIFGNGRVEEFIPATGVSVIEWRKPAVAETIIKKLAQVHRIGQLRVIKGKDNVDQLWERLEKWQEWANIIRQTLLNSTEQTLSQTEQKQLYDMSDLFEKSLVPTLKSRCQNFKSPLVLAHGDLHPGNALLKQPEQTFLLIDYEYSLMTRRAYDLANYFTEFCFNYEYDGNIDSAVDNGTNGNGGCGGENKDHAVKFSNSNSSSNLQGKPFHQPEIPNIDYFPSLTLQTHLIRIYLQELDEPFDIQTIKTLLEEIRFYLPLVQLHWMWWGLVQTIHGPASTGSFNYLKSSHQRHLLYKYFQSQSY